MGSSTEKIKLTNSIIPDELVDVIRHWSLWTNNDKSNPRVFIIVDTIDAGSVVNPTDFDFFWLLEQGTRNPDGTRKFVKIAVHKFVELVSAGSLRYFDPVTFLKTVK